jgi:hypothetical protein
MRTAVAFVLLLALAACGETNVEFQCKGTTGIYTSTGGLDAVPNDPQCAG